MIAMMGLFGLEMYPNLVLINPVATNSLNIQNAASSQKTLGVPIVLAYTVSIYWIFRGKVKLDKMSY